MWGIFICGINTIDRFKLIEHMDDEAVCIGVCNTPCTLIWKIEIKACATSAKELKSDFFVVLNAVRTN